MLTCGTSRERRGFPAGGELRIGVGSFDPRFHVREPTVQLAGDLGADTVRYQGNWIPHALRSATEDGVFFVGDSAGHCLPLTAEGIRTALYFGLACGRELRAVISGAQSHEQALARYHAFSASHALPFRWMLRAQRLIPRVAPQRIKLGGNAEAIAPCRLRPVGFRRGDRQRAGDAADLQPMPPDGQGRKLEMAFVDLAHVG